MSIEICDKECTGCTHQGYLCRQFRYLFDENEQLKVDLKNRDKEIENLKSKLKEPKQLSLF